MLYEVITQGNAKSATGGYNIPMYGGGTFADSAHLAVVGDKPRNNFV